MQRNDGVSIDIRFVRHVGQTDLWLYSNYNSVLLWRPNVTPEYKVLTLAKC